MNAYNIMFVVLAVLVVCSSIATVVTKSIIRAATYLLFVLLGTAGLYFLLGYTFLGSVQTMVYAGGIIVLYVFSILLTSGQTEAISQNNKMKTLSALLLSVAGLAVVVGIFWAHGFVNAEVLTAPSEAATPSMKEIGHQMLSTDRNGFLLPFEVVSLLLLACIVGGLMIARKR